MRVLEGGIKEGIRSSIWGIDVGAILNVRESGVCDGERHSFLW